MTLQVELKYDDFLGFLRQLSVDEISRLIRDAKRIEQEKTKETISQKQKIEQAIQDLDNGKGVPMSMEEIREMLVG